jgi:regulator of sigma E protease
MTIVYFIILIGVLIFVHELGHFLFAKLFDVKVLRFSLGFGPRAGGFRRGETDYVVAWVPLGGYVKMLGEDPKDEIKPEDQGRAFNQKPLWQRYIIVLAGPAFNLIFPIFIYFVFFAAQTHMTPSVVGKVFPGQPAEEAGLRPGDRVVTIDGNPVRYWEDLQGLISDHAGEPLRFTVERDGQSFERYITPREQVTRNRLDMEERVGRIGVSPRFELAQVGISNPTSPAARAGLRTGDIITSANGVRVDRWSQLQKLLDENLLPATRAFDQPLLRSARARTGSHGGRPRDEAGRRQDGL